MNLRSSISTCLTEYIPREGQCTRLQGANALEGRHAVGGYIPGAIFPECKCGITWHVRVYTDLVRPFSGGCRYTIFP
jgi:hypothetical protein